MACTSWALVEVPRYAFYAMNLLGSVPYPLFWLRYSLFAILYPTGITGELGCMYYSLVDLKGDSDVSVLRIHYFNDLLEMMLTILLLIIPYVSH